MRLDLKHQNMSTPALLGRPKHHDDLRHSRAAIGDDSTGPRVTLTHDPDAGHRGDWVFSKILKFLKRRTRATRT